MEPFTQKNKTSPFEPATKTILMSIVSGWEVRNWLRSGLFEQLKKEGYIIVLIAPNAEEKEFQDEFGGENIHFHTIQRGFGRLDHYLQKLRHYLFENMLVTPTSSMRLKNLKVSDPVRYFLTKHIHGDRAKRLHKIWSILDRLLVKDFYYRDVFTKYSPDVVVVATLGRIYEDLLLLRRAKKEQVKIVGILRGWDNLSTKEYFREKPDMLLIWNKFNKHEAIDYHNHPEDAVFVTGSPDFDVYKNTPYDTRETIFNEHHLDVNRKTLYLCGQIDMVIPEMGEIIEIIAQAIEEDKFVYPCQLLIRPHPLVYLKVRGGCGSESDLLEYEKLSQHVHGDRPGTPSATLSINMDSRESMHKADTLYYSDILLDFFGTMTLEACALNKPVISIGFDGYKKKPLDKSVLRFKNSTHCQRVIGAKGARVAMSKDELIEYINDYLQDPTLDEANRIKVVEENCYKVDGRSSYRMARSISAFLQGEDPRKHVDVG